MKKIHHFGFILFLLIIISGCSKEKSSITTTLYDKPLPFIKTHISGQWKLEYIYGGLVSQKHIDQHNAYMILKPDHIILGNDSTGVRVDTSIVWKKHKDIFNDSTYLLSYKWQGYPFPEYNIVDRIKNDTLIIIQNVYDPLYYYYTRY